MTPMLEILLVCLVADAFSKGAWVMMPRATPVRS
jgi:hypothetical protein